MKGLSQYFFVNDQPQSKLQFNTLRGFKICDCFFFDWQMIIRVMYFLKC